MSKIWFYYKNISIIPIFLQYRKKVIMKDWLISMNSSRNTKQGKEIALKSE